MTEATDRFAELTRQGHQVFTAAVQAWEQAARSMAGAAGRPGAQLPDVGASVDAAFDFAAQMLADQRDFTRTLMSAGAKAFAAAAQRPGTDGGTEIAEALAVQPAQDADQPGADVGAAGTPAAPEPTSPTDVGDGPPPEAPAPEAAETPAPEAPAPRKMTAAKKTAPAAAASTAAEEAPAAKKTAAARTAAKKTTAKKTTAKEPGSTGTPAKRAARRSGSGS
jgi:outer membrane biosynthesis protein TonB